MQTLPMRTWALLLAVAALIAGAAFVLAQFAPGAGMPFVALATTLWTVAFASSRRRR